MLMLIESTIHHHRRERCCGFAQNEEMLGFGSDITLVRKAITEFGRSFLIPYFYGFVFEVVRKRS